MTALECENARSARSHILSMLVFCRYTVVYSAIPQVRGTCIDECLYLKYMWFWDKVYEVSTKYWRKWQFQNVKMRKFSKLARSARSHIHRVSSMLLFCRYFVVYSAIPQVIKVNCIECICIYRCVLMCLCICVTLADFFHFFSLFFTNYADPVSVCVVLYVIILIQILIRYNVKNLITACTRSLDFDLKIEKSPYPGRGEQTLPPLGRFAPSHLSLFHSVPPPPPPMRWPTVRHWEYVSAMVSIWGFKSSFGGYAILKQSWQSFKFGISQLRDNHSYLQYQPWSLRVHFAPFQRWIFPPRGHIFVSPTPSFFVVLRHLKWEQLLHNRVELCAWDLKRILTTLGYPHFVWTKWHLYFNLVNVQLKKAGIQLRKLYSVSILCVGNKELLIIIIELNTLPKTDPWSIECVEWFLTVTEYEWTDVWFDLIVSWFEVKGQRVLFSVNTRASPLNGDVLIAKRIHNITIDCLCKQVYQYSIV